LALSVIWRPLTIAMVLTGTTLLPQGVAEAAVPTKPEGCVRSSLSGILDRLGLHGSSDPSLLPGRLLDLKNWKLTLPIGQKGKPEEIHGPDLSSFTNEFFRLNEAENGVVFTANAGGVTTSGSSYPRSELREMNGTEKAAWDSTAGTHTLDVCEAITKTPTAKPEVVSAQIHDTEDDVLQIRLEGTTLSAQYDDGKGEAVLDPAYRLGTPFRVTIVVTADGIAVSYNGEHKTDIKKSGSGWYWKVGAYVQSNPGMGEAPDAVGEVVVYSLDMSAK
jgi:poly(beta-D-mannuronate) lyase